LEQYAEIFVANDIDLDVLPDLSDDDLKELGLSLGHRRKLLRAISGSLRERSQPTIETEPSGGAVAGDGAVRTAERPQLTVLFCDLVGSGNSPACATSASSNASPAPIATISPALVALPLLPVAASPSTPSFPLSSDKSAHNVQTFRS
jgi:hypothetical protein